MDAEKDRSWLTRPLPWERLRTEHLLFAVLVLVAAVLRLWRLDLQALHHDESIHAWFSWRYVTGQELYRYNPTYHGPFLYHVTALAYLLFGASDATTRLPQALAGTAAVAALWLLRPFLGRRGTLLAALLVALSPGITYYSRFARHDAFVILWNVLMVAGLLRFLRWRRPRDLYLFLAALSLSFSTKELTYLTAFTFFSFLGARALLERFPHLRWAFGLGWSLLALLLAIGLRPLDPRSNAFALGGVLAWALAETWTLRERTVGAALASLDRQVLGRGLLVFFLPFTLLYTSLLTYPQGFLTGLVGGVAYWIAQHGVARGAQPWYYYLLTVPLYEPIAVLYGLVGGWGWVLGRRRNGDGEGTLPLDLFLWWGTLSLLIYSWAGEKMPWLTVHISLPLYLTAAWVLDRLWERIRRGPLWSPAGALAAAALLLVPFPLLVRAFLLPQLGPDLRGTYRLLDLLSGALLPLALLAWALYWLYSQRMLAHFPALLGALLLPFLGLYTVRSAVQLSFYHPDVPVELLVYTQTAPDTTELARTLVRLAEEKSRLRRTDDDPTGGHRLKVAIDPQLAWPFSWYLRDLKGVLYALPPDLREYDAVLVLKGKAEEVRTQLGAEYLESGHNLRWWFPEHLYRNLTWRRALSPLTDAEAFRTLWRYLWYRELPAPLGSMEYVAFLRADLVPGLGRRAARPSPPEGEGVGPDPLAPLLSVREPNAVLGEGVLQAPRGLALAPDGSRLYVTDTGLNQVLVLDPKTGQVLDRWGEAGEGPGQFQEPWGIGLAPDGGRIYVADTWNGRIQAFDAQGTFLFQIGRGGIVDTGGTREGNRRDPQGFYGPRAVAVDRQGRVYVVDTGNERVLVFSPEGTYLFQWGEAGEEPGQFREPVGIALDEEGRAYVADTWNGRIQRFVVGDGPPAGPDLTWPVPWRSRSTTNKPYLSLLPQGLLALTLPDRNQVALYTRGGVPLSVWGGPGRLAYPTGLAVDPRTNRLYVADAGHGRILVYDLGTP